MKLSMQTASMRRSLLKGILAISFLMLGKFEQQDEAEGGKRNSDALIEIVKAYQAMKKK
jgi:hypothetical protein